MKKIVALMLALVLCLGTVNALAAGKLNVVQENFHAIKSYGSYGYAFAKVENSGDRPIKVNSGVLEMFDDNGEVLASTDYIEAGAQYLAPGEYTYVMAYERIEDENAVAKDYSLTLTGKSDNSYSCPRLACSAALELNVPDKWGDPCDYMVVTVTNNTEDTVFDICTVYALLDAAGNILYMNEYSTYSMGLAAGSSMILQELIPSEFSEYYAANNLMPASVDAIAYTEVENE